MKRTVEDNQEMDYTFCDVCGDICAGSLDSLQKLEDHLGRSVPVEYFGTCEYCLKTREECFTPAKEESKERAIGIHEVVCGAFFLLGVAIGRRKL